MSARNIQLLKSNATQIFVIRNCATVFNAQPFESIPGPPGKGLPFLGHANLYAGKPAGESFKFMTPLAQYADFFQI